MLSYFESSFTYLETVTFEMADLICFGVFPDFDFTETTGLIIGLYKNRDIQMCSISLQKHIGEGDMKAIFEGIIIKVNL